LALSFTIHALATWDDTLLPPDGPSQSVTPGSEPDDPEESDPESEPSDEVPPDDSEEPLTNNNGTDPDAITDDDNGDPEYNDTGDEQIDLDDPEQEQGPNEPEPPRLNIAGGRMFFSFSPASHDSLDADIISMMGDLLTSPLYTNDARVLIEIPDLPTEYSSLLKAEINSAFATHGVAQQNLSYITYETDIVADSFEVRLSFTHPSNRK